MMTAIKLSRKENEAPLGRAKDLRRRLDDAVIGCYAVVLIAFTLFLLAPLLMAVVMSFDQRNFLGRFPPPGLSLRWYEAFFSDDMFLAGLRTSIVVALLTAVLATACGTAAALFLDFYRFRGRDALIALFLSPLVVPHVVLGFALLMLLTALGIEDALLRLVIGHVIVTLPYTIRTVLASLAGIKPSLVEAAMSLGATERRAVFDVVLPLARTGIVAGGVMALALSMDEVTMSLFLVDPYDYTLQTALFSTMRDSFNLTIAAATVLLMVISTVAIVLLDRLVGLDRLIGRGMYRS